MENELAVPLKTKEFVLQHHNQTEQLIEKTNAVISSIREIEFSETNIKIFDSKITDANKLKTAIGDFRKGYKNDYLSVIQEDLDKLMDFEKNIVTEVKLQTANKDAWKQKQHEIRYQNLKTAFDSLIHDFSELKELGLMLEHVIPEDWRLAKYKTLNPIIEKITNNLNEKNIMLKLIDNKELWAKCDFNLVSYNKMVNSLPPEKVYTPVENTTDIVTIELHKNYLETLDELGVKYVIKREVKED